MMQRYVTLTLGFLLLALVAPAQNRARSANAGTKGKDTGPFHVSYSLTAWGGLTQFFGELNNQDLKFAGGLGFGTQLTPAFGLSLEGAAGRLGGDKLDFFNSYFINEYNSVDLLARWDLTEQFSRKKKKELHLSVYAGLGMMYFSSVAYDVLTDQPVRFTNSQASGRTPLFLRWGPGREPLGIKKTHERTIPLGVNVKRDLSDHWQFGLDFRFYFARTDKLDATSGMRLINPEESNSYSDTPNDKFSFISAGFTYKF